MGGIHVCSGGWRPDSHVDQEVFHAGGGDQFGWLDFLLHGKCHGASSALAETDSDCLGLCPWCYGGGRGALLPGMLKIFLCSSVSGACKLRLAGGAIIGGGDQW